MLSVPLRVTEKEIGSVASLRWEERLERRTNTQRPSIALITQKCNSTVRVAVLYTAYSGSIPLTSTI